MATSATCVIGLAVHDVYSFLGRLIILVAIQAGGIGILVLAMVVVQLMFIGVYRWWH